MIAKSSQLACDKQEVFALASSSPQLKFSEVKTLDLHGINTKGNKKENYSYHIYDDIKQKLCFQLLVFYTTNSFF